MPYPKKGEKKSDYVSRCVKIRQNEHPDEDNDQSVAICNSMWDQAKKKKKTSEKIKGRLI